MTELELDQDSVVVTIVPPTPEQIKQSKQIIKDFQIKINTDHNRFDLYMTVNKVYLQNLFARKEKPNIHPEIKSRLGHTCIIYKEFLVDPTQAKQFLGHQKQIKGNIHILYNPQTNAEFKIWFNQQVKRDEDFIWIVLHYTSSGAWKSKNFTPIQDAGKYTCKIKAQDLNDYLDPNLLFNITVRRKETSNSEHLGIINLGNTCFMNSCLQMLFYIRPLRKIIIESKPQNKIIKVLKDVFIKLLDTQEKRPVDVQNLLQSYEKYNQLPRQQQDVQQFLLDFINQIQKQCPEVKSLWEGKCSQTTISKEQDKPYKSTQVQNFAQLDVHMFDPKGNYFDSIQHSLNSLIHEQLVDELIENEQFGKITVSKYRKFQSLPDILFVNLKRYEWSKEKLRLSKILSHIRYGQDLNMGFIIGTPGNTDLNPQYDYKLYSVIVHKGTSPHNGHYFVFVNTSGENQSPNWIQFNDSMVRISGQEQVLKFTGKNRKETILDKQMGRFVQKDLQSDQSSYLLVYLRRQRFDEYQSLETPIPKYYLKEKLHKTAQKQKQNIQQVKVYTLTSAQQSEDIFSNDLQYMSVPLAKNDSVKQQLKKLSKSLLGCNARLMLRVYVDQKKVKALYSYESAEQIVKFQRGHINCSYILMMAQNIKNVAENGTNNPLGLLRIQKNELESVFYLPKISVITLYGLQDLKRRVAQKGGEIVILTDLANFKTRWNLLVQIQIVKAFD